LKRLLQRWLAPVARLTVPQRDRLEAWMALAPADRKTGFGQARYVVVDVETTGLNLMADRLISIGAVAVVNERIVLGDSFSVVLQQQEVSRKENILVHGISSSAQREGVEPVDALLDFLDYLGKSPLVAFHVTFDETMIRRALKQYLGLSFSHAWLDLAYVMPALYPTLAHNHRGLDDWIARFDIRIEARHNALADAMATAQLFQVALSRARHKDITAYAGLHGLERSQRLAQGVS
jgi:DNA polymerase-3 subunit epsilon